MDREDFLRRIGGDDALARQLAEVLGASLPALETTLAEAVDRQDIAAVERAAHAIKGSVATFSAWPAMRAAERLETLGRGRAPAAAAALAPAHTALHAELAALKAHLHAHFADGPP